MKSGSVEGAVIGLCHGSAGEPAIVLPCVLAGSPAGGRMPTYQHHTATASSTLLNCNSLRLGL
jgi:hypothetical protein